jgi:hypothetical protein
MPEHIYNEGIPVDESAANIEDIKARLNEAISAESNLSKSEAQKTFESERARTVESLGYSVEVNDNQHFVLVKNGFRIQLKHYLEPSERGFENGKISAIELKKGEQYALWDSEWIDEPTDDEVRGMFDELVGSLNS